MAQNLNARGQAAVTDALFFLVIVTSLGVFLFGFSANYGANVSEQFSARYSSDFSVAAIKSILYASVSRSTGQLVSGSDSLVPADTDYLLAFVKEDYFDDRKLGDPVRVGLANAVYSLLSPIGSSKDYLFAVYEGSSGSGAGLVRNGKPVFVLAHISDIGFSGKDLVIPDEKHFNYECSERGTESGITFDRQLSLLRASLGESQQYFSNIMLWKRSSGTDLDWDQVPSPVLLLVWTPKPKNQLKFDSGEWGCTEMSLADGKLSFP
ncbi:MAG: hypothetical protein HY917_01670 [Candidatus Diapherotrites archaeon]|nr:hypothetical protein [Candidatus Diapherotrites archaeon]